PRLIAHAFRDLDGYVVRVFDGLVGERAHLEAAGEDAAHLLDDELVEAPGRDGHGLRFAVERIEADLLHGELVADRGDHRDALDRAYVLERHPRTSAQQQHCEQGARAESSHCEHVPPCRYCSRRIVSIVRGRLRSSSSVMALLSRILCAASKVAGIHDASTSRAGPRIDIVVSTVSWLTRIAGELAMTVKLCPSTTITW